MQPSNKQQAILDVWTQENKNILISAVAGSGKTSTLLMLLEKCESRVLIVAFNKSIQEEFTAKMEARGLDQGLALTAHALGLKAIKHAGIKCKIVKNKNWDLIKKMQSIRRDTYRQIKKEDWLKVNFSLFDLLDASRMFLTDDLEELRRLLLGLDKVVSDHRTLPVLWETLTQLRDEVYQQKFMEIDFLDMIYIPVIKDLEIPVYATYLMIDEAQDLNLCQHKLIDKLLQGTVEKWIAVGDRNQAIYGFSGASSKSFDMFLEKENVIEMPLDICYRSARSIIAKANEVYDIMLPGIEEEGLVETITSIEYLEPNSMLICRNTNPLVEVYFQLLGKNIPCYINGSDLMSQIINFLKPYSSKNIHSASVEMRIMYEELEENKDKDDGASIKFHVFKNNFNNFFSLVNHMCDPMDSIELLIERLKYLFETKEGAVMLCTIHKSKGLEADTVYILQESLIPSKYAKSGEQLKQEKNLKYVARTRAKKNLYFLNLGFKDE